MLDLSSAWEIAIDKHSTGGVGDKTTLVVGPIAAACGLPVGKMSGRGLGFSGGTLDKMESIPGYRCDLSQEEFLAQLREYKIVLTGQSADLAPADGKMYALRDVTGTVPSMPLIASSVMSKKIAAGAHAIVLDVKLGEGAFMANLEDAQQLARIMVAIGKLSGRRVVALLSDMNQPLGEAFGNALETREAIETLRGGGPADFREHCLVVASHMLVLGQRAKSLDEARQMAEAVLQDGRALEFFRTLVRQQGGDVSYVDQPDKLPKANLVEPLKAPRSGWLKAVRARVIGETSVDLGAGRAKKGDLIDYGVGIIVHHKVGDRVETSDPLFTIHASDAAHLTQAKERLQTAIEWSDTDCEPLPLFYGVVEQL